MNQEKEKIKCKSEVIYRWKCPKCKYLNEEPNIHPAKYKTNICFMCGKKFKGTDFLKES